MVKILLTTKKDILDFNKREWTEADRGHYGKSLDWKERKFILKALDGNIIVGTLKMKIQAQVAYVQEIIVTKEKRHKGVGRQLLQKAEQIAKKKGCHKVHLITGQEWDSISFYGSCGYQKTGILPKHFGKLDFVEFTKFIP